MSKAKIMMKKKGIQHRFEAGVGPRNRKED
jgi:hypothetical protein